MKKQIASIILAYAVLLPAENLVFNGSFELGTDGFAQKRVLRPDTNPKLEYSPLEITTENVVDGKNALQMRNPFAEKIELIGKEFPVKKGHTYICRGSIRSSVPNTFLTVRIFSENFWEAFTKRINAGPEWKTFSYEFVPFNSDPHHLEIIYTDLKKIPAGTFWIDKLEIFEKGTEPEAGPQIALRIGEPILENGTQGTLELCAVSDRDFSGSLELLCKEDYDGTILLKKKFDLELKPGEIKKKEFTIPAGHNGGYTASVSGKDIRCQQADFIVCRKVPKHRIDPAKEFAFGINWGLAKEWHPGTEQKGYKVWTAPFARDIEMLSAIGCRILHKKRLTSAEWIWLKMLLTGMGDKNVRYVMIDEVQDYTAAQLMVLRRYFGRAKFMMLGDEFQAIRPGTVSFAKIHELFGEDGRQTKELPLLTSYRSSPEITEIFTGLLPREKRIVTSSVQRPGTAPVVMACESGEDYARRLRLLVHAAESANAVAKDGLAAGAIAVASASTAAGATTSASAGTAAGENTLAGAGASTAEDEQGLTAVICANRASLEKVRQILGDEAPQVIHRNQALPHSGVFLITLNLVKGLEFDGVILPDADQATYPDDLMARHRLYTAVSRATRRLSILADGELTSLLK